MVRAGGAIGLCLPGSIAWFVNDPAGELNTKPGPTSLVGPGGRMPSLIAIGCSWATRPSLESGFIRKAGIWNLLAACGIGFLPQTPWVPKTRSPLEGAQKERLPLFTRNVFADESAWQWVLHRVCGKDDGSRATEVLSTKPQVSPQDNRLSMRFSRCPDAR